MPTPVSSARQCLTEEAARALDDAVTVAKRRSHAQTTSLHAVSALLALPSSALREACARARSSAYSPRLQFKALELCVGVSLDRLPTTKATEEPPISNSLMAAIKRSQANQRRHPETFHLYQQLQHQAGAGNSSSPPPSISTVKVELKHFILSILDDPIVSRVFGEAGFRSFELKIAILNPPTISRFSKPRCPPLFLCNLSDLELNKRGFSFPFPGGVGSSSSGENWDENSRRIGEVFIKKTARNPLLVGNSASDALNEFIDVVRMCKVGVLPREIEGLCVVSLVQDLSDLEKLRLKFEEIEDVVKGCQGGAGVVISYGDLKVFVDPGEGEKYAVSELSRLVKVYDKKLWLIGYAANFDVYMKFLAQFSCAEKDWDLHFMPITSSKPPSVGGAGLPSRSSLMGSFVPFGGFFSAPSDFEPPRSITNQSAARCTMCNEKYEQEASAVLKEGSTVSASEQYSENLSPWMQITEADKRKSFSNQEAKDDRSVGNARLMALDIKWNDICRHIHQASPSKAQYQNIDEFKLSSARSRSSTTDSLLDERRLPDQSPCIRSDSQNADSLLGSPVQRPNVGNLRSLPFAFEYMKDTEPLNQKTSVTTDLVLGTLYAAPIKDPSNPKHQECNDRLQHSGSVSADASSENASNHVTHSFYSSRKHPDEKDFKYLWRLLSEKVSWQDEAVSTLSRIVASCRNGHGHGHGNGHSRGPDRGNMWLSLLGPDKVGKRKLASALAEALFGSTKNLIRVDLGSLSRNRSSNTIFDWGDSKSYEKNLRGKTMVDHIADELSKKSESVVLLENVDEADILVQNSLSQALKTGKFPNSHMREVNVNNRVFVITSGASKGAKDFFSGNDLSSEYSEERVIAAADSQMQIHVGCASRNAVRIRNTNVLVSSKKGDSFPSTAGKRKFADDIESTESPKRIRENARSSFDLNLPVEEMEEEEGDYNSSDSDCVSESSKAWLEDFLDQVSGNVVLNPFDFGVLAQKILTQIDLCFKKAVGSSHFLEIESETVLQMLAASWLAEKKNGVDDWIREVLYRAFVEASHRCSLGPNTVVKLTALGRGTGVEEEEHCPGICLPVRVSVV